MLGICRRPRRLALLALGSAILAACGTNGPALVASPATTVPVFGFDYGPYTVGDGPGATVPDARIEKMLTILKGKTLWIKVPDVSGGIANVPRIAHRLGFKVAASVYITKDNPQGEAAGIKQLEIDIDNGWVDLAAVGVESVWGKYKTVPQLEADLDRVRSYIRGRVPLTTIEPDFVWMQHPELAQHVDVVMANITPFSLGHPYSEALSYMTKSYADLGRLTQKEVWIGETEWATDGGLHSASLANLDTATNYFAQVEHWARQNQVKMFYYEAFDEPYEGKIEAPFGDHWGVFTSDGTLKKGMERGFNPP
jgi:exo-beta-1,3-glucanase (GH17 family)